MNVYGYVRVSTDRQADEGESLGTQQRTIEGYAMMQGMTLCEIFIAVLCSKRHHDKIAAGSGITLPYPGGRFTRHFRAP
jgi:DNA invertase Pin-like site-specific DNA recombinase